MLSRFIALGAATLMTMSFTAVAKKTDLKPLYEDNFHLTYHSLIVDIHGYKVPTKAAFNGWVILNNNKKKVENLTRRFRRAGIQETMPIYLVLLQGTDWATTQSAMFTLPNSDNIPNMIRTLNFIQDVIEPELGVVIPVSGERSSSYNREAGGAAKSKHLQFCALDLVPASDITRSQLHQKLIAIYRKHGKKNNLGLGLYSGVRFHIDTCGFRQW